jgi:hypothetical protein
MASPSPLLTADLRSFFAQAVAEATRRRPVAISRHVEAYVVGLLVDCSHADRFFSLWSDEPLALLLHQALAAAPSDRFDRLRSLGDGVLYASGFFRDHLVARGATVDYCGRVGASAYQAASATLRAFGGEDGPDVLGELAAHFGELSGLVAEVAEDMLANAAHTPADIVRLYERWLASRSPRLLATLSELGAVPHGGSGMLH